MFFARIATSLQDILTGSKKSFEKSPTRSVAQRRSSQTSVSRTDKARMSNSSLLLIGRVSGESSTIPASGIILLFLYGLLPTLPVLDNRTLVDRIVDAGCHDSKAGAGGQAARQFQPQVSVMFPWVHRITQGASSDGLPRERNNVPNLHLLRYTLRFKWKKNRMGCLLGLDSCRHSGCMSEIGVSQADLECLFASIDDKTTRTEEFHFEASKHGTNINQIL